MNAIAPDTGSPGTGNDVSLERQAEAWMDDPFAALGQSNTRIHSIPREEAEAVQLTALRLRLAERRERIQVLARLADSQGVHALAALDDAAPLLFTHDVYKSYPVSLLARQRFDQLTTWLSRLTAYDVSDVDVSTCSSIDGWLTRLREETPLDVATSSGTSGTLSLFPKSKKDYLTSVKGLRVQLAQTFGEPPRPADLDDKIHALTPLYRDGHSTTGRFAHYLLQVFGKGDEAYLHTAFPFKISSDLMWLAARLRAVAARGGKVDVPESLLARRGEWEQMQAEAPGVREAFVRRVVDELRGQRVFCMGTTHMFYEVAHRGLQDGAKGAFTADSVLMGGGGAKGMILPDDAEDTITAFFGIPRMRSAYGMTEMNAFSISCEHGRYHLPPWVTPFVLDPQTGKPLPREGVQTGRAAFFDATQDGVWGGIVTGDRISLDFGAPCPCGRTTLHLDKTIQRFSEIQGGDDKITCAATPTAQGEALDFLTALDA